MKLFKERYGYEINSLLKLFKVTRICEDSIEFKWGYISFNGWPQLKIDHTYEEGIPRLCFCLILIAFHVELPFIKQRYDDVNNSPTYGLEYHSNTLWWNWGLKSYNWDSPWSWDHISHEVMTNDGWVSCINEYLDRGDSSYKDLRIVETHPYTYVLNTGEVQKRKATIYQERRTWKWKWFKLLPYPKMVRTSINIDFDDEVGEGTGSWKGGTTGCGYDIKKGEPMLACLRRMESERKFSR